MSEFDNTDLNTILAALRYYQEQGMGDPENRSDDIHEIATNGDTDVSLDDAGIDDLCERLNFGNFVERMNAPAPTPRM